MEHQHNVSNRILSFEEWYDTFADEINTELAENGADRELEFNAESEFRKRYEAYLNASQVDNVLAVGAVRKLKTKL